MQSSIGRLLTIIDESLMGMRIIRSFNATDFILKGLAGKMISIGKQVYRALKKENWHLLSQKYRV